MHVYFFFSQGYDHDFTVHFFLKDKKAHDRKLNIFFAFKNRIVILL
jgi:hypothetical protein